MRITYRKIASELRAAVTRLNDTIYPRRCPVCEQIVTPPDRGICAACVPQVPFVAPPHCL